MKGNSSLDFLFLESRPTSLLRIQFFKDLFNTEQKWQARLVLIQTHSAQIQKLPITWNKVPSFPSFSPLKWDAEMKDNCFPFAMSVTPRERPHHHAPNRGANTAPSTAHCQAERYVPNCSWAMPKPAPWLPDTSQIPPGCGAEPFRKQTKFCSLGIPMCYLRKPNLSVHTVKLSAMHPKAFQFRGDISSRPSFTLAEARPNWTATLYLGISSSLETHMGFWISVGFQDICINRIFSSDASW